jgi:hypothetical protein
MYHCDSTVHTQRLNTEFVFLSMLDGTPVDMNSAKVRCVWEEALVNEDFLLVLRPGNWVSLPPAEDGEED